MADTGSNSTPADSGTPGKSSLNSQIRLKSPVSFGAYELLQRVRVGGMAEVFKACRKDAPDRPLALKRILPSFTDEVEYVQMFLDEAALAMRFDHPCIVSGIERGQWEDNHYIAFEYIAGQDTAALFQRAQQRSEPLPAEVVCQIALRICEALHYAHTLCDEAGQPLGIVHRDVSPQNLLVSYRGEVKLIDFGVAKSTAQAMRTEPGFFKGKRGYLSPEQASGTAVDARSDLFALGTCMYELLTGQRLFKGSSDLSTLQRVRQAQVPALARPAGVVAPQLEAVVRRALEKSPGDRFDTASDFGQAIEAVVRELGYPGPECVASYMEEAFGDGSDREAQLEAGPVEDEGTGLDAFDDVAPVSTVSALAALSQGEDESREAEVAEGEDAVLGRLTGSTVPPEPGVEFSAADAAQAAPAQVEQAHGLDTGGALAADLQAELEAHEVHTLSEAGVEGSASQPILSSEPEPQSRPQAVAQAPVVAMDWDEEEQLQTANYDEPHLLEPLPAQIAPEAYPPAAQSPSTGPVAEGPAARSNTGVGPAAATVAGVPPSQQTTWTGAAAPSPAAAAIRWAALAAVVGGVAVAAFLGWAPQSATVHVATVPLDTRVFVNGVEHAGSASPYVLSELEPGERHLLEVRKAGFASWRTRLTLRSGQVLTLPTVTLIREGDGESGAAPAAVPPMASTAQPPSTRAPAAAAPAAVRRRADPRPTRAERESEGASTQTVSSSAAAAAPTAPKPAAKTLRPRAAAKSKDLTPKGGRLSLSAKGDPAPDPGKAEPPAATVADVAEAQGPAPSVRADGKLRLNSRPWSQVYVDGRAVGNTPQPALMLPSGKHTIRLVNPDFELEKTFVVDVPEGGEVTKIVNLVE